MHLGYSLVVFITLVIRPTFKEVVRKEPIVKLLKAMVLGELVKLHMFMLELEQLIRSVLLLEEGQLDQQAFLVQQQLGELLSDGDMSFRVQ